MASTHGYEAARTDEGAVVATNTAGEIELQSPAGTGTEIAMEEAGSTPAPLQKGKSMKEHADAGCLHYKEHKWKYLACKVVSAAAIILGCVFGMCKLSHLQTCFQIYNLILLPKYSHLHKYSHTHTHTKHQNTRTNTNL